MPSDPPANPPAAVSPSPRDEEAHQRLDAIEKTHKEHQHDHRHEPDHKHDPKHSEEPTRIAPRGTAEGDEESKEHRVGLLW